MVLVDTTPIPSRSLPGSLVLGWMAVGIGITLVYAAIKNISPLDVITGTITGDAARRPIDTTTTTIGVGSSPVGGSGGSAVGESAGSSVRARRLANREITPTLVPIPTQPTKRLDAEALASFMRVQAEYGKPLILTGAWRSEQSQAQGHAQDPNRFAPPGKGGHPVGIAVDLHTDRVNVNDPRLYEIFTRNGWYRAGKSGPMHWSYGVPI